MNFWRLCATKLVFLLPALIPISRSDSHHRRLRALGLRAPAPLASAGGLLGEFHWWLRHLVQKKVFSIYSTQKSHFELMHKSCTNPLMPLEKQDTNEALTARDEAMQNTILCFVWFHWSINTLVISCLHEKQVQELFGMPSFSWFYNIYPSILV